MIYLSLKNLIILVIVAGLSGCASTASKWQDDSSDKINKELTVVKDRLSLGNKAVSDEWSSALLPPLDINLVNKHVVSPIERFDVSVNKGKARDVYLNLVKGTKFGVILDPSINGKITLRLKNVTLDEVFTYLESSYGYHYEKNTTHYIISGNKLITKIFHIDYINVTRGGSSSTNVTTGGLKEGAPAGVEIITKSEVDFWGSLTTDLKAIVGEKEGHHITVNQQSGIILVKALPNEIRIIKKYLQQVQSSISRQVILEAKLLEVELSDGYQTGINWGKIFTSGSRTLGINQVGGGTALAGAQSTGIGGNTTNDIATSGINGGIASAFGGVFSLALQSGSFGAFIEMIRTQGKVQVLSSPRIATINNQKAVIKVGGEEFYVTGVKAARNNSSNPNTTSNPVPTVTMQAFFSGIALDVTPQIGKDETITLHLHPTVTNVTQKNKSFIVYDFNFNLPLATSSVRETDSVVRAKSGQIIVVGGLMKQSTTEDNASVPFLSSIPLIGRLFKQNKATRIKKELVILVKPTLVEQDSDWSNEAATSMMRFSELRD